jgi:hypothetical protein
VVSPLIDLRFFAQEAPMDGHFLTAQPVAGFEYPPDDHQAKQEKSARHRDAD